MSLNNTIYDQCEYEQQTNESTSPLQYQLYSGPYYNCSCCDSSAKGDNSANRKIPLHSGQNRGWPQKSKNDVKSLVDLESDLWNITRKLSTCSSNKYNGQCGCDITRGDNTNSSADRNSCGRKMGRSLGQLNLNKVKDSSCPSGNCPVPLPGTCKLKDSLHNLIKATPPPEIGCDLDTNINRHYGKGFNTPPKTCCN
jgi:hypothetical protein